MTVHDIDPNFQTEVWLEHWEELKNLGSMVFESDHRTKSGEVFPVEIAANYVEFAGQEYNCAFARDITERKRAEEALRKAEEEKALVLNSSLDLVVYHDTNLRVLWANQTAGLLVDKSPEELKGRHCFEVWHQRTEPCKDCPVVLARDTGEPHEGEVASPDGRQWYIRGYPTKDENGQVVGIVEFCLDITEKKRVEEALRESEERYRTLMETNPDPVIVYDIEGNIVYFNPAFTRVFGWTPEELQYKRMERFVPEDDMPDAKAMMVKLLSGESLSGIESRRYTKEGDIIPVSMSGAMYRDQDDSPLGYMMNLRDISGQRRMEAQLQQAQKMEAVGTLAGGIAHDFNNLLQAVQGYAELLLSRKEGGKLSHQGLQAIVRAARRGAELTRQLLTFSRKVDSQLRPIDLNRKILGVREILLRTIPKMIEINFDLRQEVRTIEADPGQIEQILMNLAVNAKDAMPDGGKLTIATENVTLDDDFCRMHAGSKPGDYVMLTVADNGHGMDEETLDHIFEPFYTTKGVGKGTGLGLATVYGIVKGHLGYVACHSEKGQGTSFNIYFPVLEDETDWPEQRETEHPLVGGSETILLIDDEDFVRDLGEQIIGDVGYKVLTASDGESGLEIYQREKEHIELIILDLIMPGMGGRKCLEKLLDINPDAKVLIASGYSDFGPVTETLAAGAKSFVSKPYKIKEILSVIREVLDGKSPG
jgi:PAS domain S-box-containing protein